MAEKILPTSFFVIGPETRRKFFPYLNHLPRPGQWVWIESPTVGVARILAQIASVNTLLINDNLFQVRVEINRASMKEDILFAKLSRRIFNLIDRDKEILEPIFLTEAQAKAESISHEVRTLLPSYSNANYSNNEVSNQ